MIDQLVVLKQLGEVRTKIHSLCEKTQCSKYKKCIKHSTICTNDEQSLFRKVIRNNGGDFELYIKLRKQLMEYNYPLVISVCNKIGGYSKDDLCQEGMLGLCEAIDRFKFSYGNQLSTFAYHYIRKWVLEFIRENQTVKLANRISYLTKVSELAFDRLTQKHKYSACNITSKELLKEVQLLRKERNMSNMVIRDSEVKGHLERLKLQSSMADIMPLEPNKYEYQEYSDSLYELLNKELDKDLIDVEIWLAEAIKLRFGLGSYTRPTTLQEIAAAIGKPRQTTELNIKKFFEKRGPIENN